MTLRELLALLEPDGPSWRDALVSACSLLGLGGVLWYAMLLDPRPLSYHPWWFLPGTLVLFLGLPALLAVGGLLYRHDLRASPPLEVVRRLVSEDVFLAYGVHLSDPSVLAFAPDVPVVLEVLRPGASGRSVQVEALFLSVDAPLLLRVGGKELPRA